MRIALQLYRILILVAIAWILRDHAVRMRVESLRSVTLEEAKELFPSATELAVDYGPKGGWDVLDAAGSKLGYIVQTAPVSDKIIGYRGWTNALVAFSPELRVLGVRIRASQDTVDHVADVKGDRYFMKLWNGKTWDEIAGRTPEEEGIEGVSGATMTSLAMAEGIMRRLKSAEEAALPPPPWRVQARDIGLAVVVAIGCALAFLGTHGRAWLRRGFQLLVIAYVGFINGDLLAQTLMVGWAQNGAPWRTAPGLVLLLAAAIVIPWSTGKPLYCQQICPHGHLQEWLARTMPKRIRLRLPKGLERGLRWLPPLTLGYVLAVTFLVLPVDLANVEPFDAYLITSAGIATIVVAVVSLIAACFVPMAYCHYGCPTGAVFNFVRRHGSTDHFGRREIAALLLVGLAWGLSRVTQSFHDWIQSPASDWL
jgi:NosR/NirI family transcriptional regulator, nitrous oxide reductase regulator